MPFDFDAPVPTKITSRPYKSSGAKSVSMNVFDDQMVEAKMIFHAEGHETGLNLLVTEIYWPPNNVTLPHIHELEDESFFILEGSVAIRIGPPDQERETIELSKGEFGWAPRNHWHEVNVGPEGAHVLLIQTPGSQLSSYFRFIGSEIQIESQEDFERMNEWSRVNFGLQFWSRAADLV
jgi:mannose-6-phosphate isomerase-like protein (cupin superfamily)